MLHILVNKNNINDLFEKSCIKGYLITSKWLYQLGLDTNNPINIHAGNEVAFRWSCRNGYVEIAKWLVSINDQNNYYLKIEDDKIIDWKIINIIDKALDEINNNDYNKAYKLLDINNEKNIKAINNCLICKSKEEEMIDIDCGYDHYYCLECLLLSVNVKQEYKCLYCFKLFKFNQCYKIIKC